MLISLSFAHIFSMLASNVNCFKHLLWQQCVLQKSERFFHPTVRVRFAPSPTGLLHIGGLRTALYNYLFARKHKDGKFIVRIEDTDQERIVPGAKERLISSLEWVGIDTDESFLHGGHHGPYLQSQRLHHYKRYADQLVSSGSAYHCFCSNRRLALLKKSQHRRHEMPRYDNRCRSLSEEEVGNLLSIGKSSVIRLKIPSGTHHFTDSLFGNLTHDISKSEGDPVLLKSDGYPTYHLANVVDDHLMEITHVIRGKEWLISTFKHVVMYEAFGWKQPVFTHLPLLVNKDKKKLSKRQGEVFVDQYKENGYSAASILNFLAAYGSGFRDLKLPIGTDDCTEILAALSNAFDPHKLVTSDATVELSRLDHFSSVLTARRINQPCSKQQMIADLHRMVLEKYADNLILNVDGTMNSSAETYIQHILETRQNHIIKLNDLVSDEYSFLWVRPVACLSKDDLRFHEMLRDFRKNAESVERISHDNMQTFLKNLAKRHSLRFPVLMKFLRKTLTGLQQGPSVAEVMLLLGNKETLLRVGETLKRMEHLKT